MKPYAEWFYKSKRWQRTAASYAKSKHYLCEICQAEGRITPGEIVHHMIHITPENINDPSITLNPDNLQLLCRDHHAEVHSGRKKRFKIDDLGRITPIV